MILAGESERRDEALAQLLPVQQQDFAGILEAMDGLPVTIRLLDPPLHEFLPREEAALEAMAGSSASRPRRWPPRPRRWPSSTRCSATAAAGWA